MRTAVISDLHLGAGSGVDMLRRPQIRDVLVGELDGADRIVLLGDVIELRDRPLPEALERASEALGAIGSAAGAAEVIVVAGNHDHHLVEPWLQRRALAGSEPLALEQLDDPDEGPLSNLAELLAPATVRFAYPGLWIREDVYATHGHYLDRHLTIPTLERLGVALVERLLGIEPGGPDPLAPPTEPAATADEYERVQAPVYAFLFGLAQATVGARPGGADPSLRVWKMLSGSESRVARMRSWLLGSVALPGAVGIANRLGLGPVAPDLSPKAIAKAGVLAMGEVVERLEIGAPHVIFGHTHRRGPLRDEPGWTVGETRLWNTGSWVHTPSLLGRTASVSQYWRGTVAVVDDDGPPEMRNLLEGL
ncbi:MAG TPA: metallophosphoesterase, partial [Solirubrobacterales bacterium]|nr:metallophosphoesterase [Solirubrobacterales bacterium]